MPFTTSYFKLLGNNRSCTGCLGHYFCKWCYNSSNNASCHVNRSCIISKIPYDLISILLCCFTCRVGICTRSINRILQQINFCFFCRIRHIHINNAYLVIFSINLQILCLISQLISLGIFIISFIFTFGHCDINNSNLCFASCRINSNLI